MKNHVVVQISKTRWVVVEQYSNFTSPEVNCYRPCTSKLVIEFLAVHICQELNEKEIGDYSETTKLALLD